MYKRTVELYVNKILVIEKLHILLEALNKIDNIPGNCIFGFYNIYIGKLTDHFFTNIDDKTESLENITLFTTLK